jgi:hypothetical protein
VTSPSIVVSRAHFHHEEPLGRVTFVRHDPRSSIALDTARKIAARGHGRWRDAVGRAVGSATFLAGSTLGWVILRPKAAVCQEGFRLIDEDGRAMPVATPEEPFLCALGSGSLLFVACQLRWSHRRVIGIPGLAVMVRRDRATAVRLERGGRAPEAPAGAGQDLEDALEAAEAILTTGTLHAKAGPKRLEATGRELAKAGYAAAAEAIDRFRSAKDEGDRARSLLESYVALTWTALLGWTFPQDPVAAPKSGSLAPSLRVEGDFPAARALLAGDAAAFADAMLESPETLEALSAFASALPEAAVRRLGSSNGATVCRAFRAAIDPDEAGRFLAQKKAKLLESWGAPFVAALERARRGLFADSARAAGLSKADLEALQRRARLDDALVRDAVRKVWR